MTSYIQLDNQFIRYWNQWYDMACFGKVQEAHNLAKTLFRFMKGKDGQLLINETNKCIVKKKIHIPILHSFNQQVDSMFSSLIIYLQNPGLVPEPLSEYFSNMQMYMVLCR
jgi:hypothetical protein